MGKKAKKFRSKCGKCSGVLVGVEIKRDLELKYECYLCNDCVEFIADVLTVAGANQTAPGIPVEEKLEFFEIKYKKRKQKKEKG